MPAQQTNPTEASAKRSASCWLAHLAGLLALLLGTLVLFGWYTHNSALIQVNPAFVPMQYNTALGFVLGGIGLLALLWSMPRLAQLAGALLLAIGTLTLFEYIFAVDLGIDQLFMRHYIDLETSNPGRMAPNTALCFSLTAIAILATAFKPGKHALPAGLGAAVVGLGMSAFTGYLIGAENAYGWGHLTRMAVHTAAGFVVLGIGLIALALA